MNPLDIVNGVSSGVAGLANAGVAIAGAVETSKQNEFNRDFATKTFEQEQDNWERAFRQNQSNFENQYSVTARDMQRAGFNPMSLFNGGSLSQANSAPASPELPSGVNQRSSMQALHSEMLQNEMLQAQIDNINSQTEKNKADAGYISEHHSWLSGENEADRAARKQLEEMNIDAQKYLADFDRETKTLVQNAEFAQQLLLQQNDQSWQSTQNALERSLRGYLSDRETELRKTLQFREHQWQAWQNNVERAARLELERVKEAASQDRLKEYLENDMSKFELTNKRLWTELGVNAGMSAVSEIRHWLSAVFTGGLSEIFGSKSPAPAKPWESLD